MAFFNKKKKKEVPVTKGLSLDDFSAIPDDKTVREVVVEDERKSEDIKKQTAEENYQTSSLPKNEVEQIDVKVKENFVDEIPETKNDYELEKPIEEIQKVLDEESKTNEIPTFNTPTEPDTIEFKLASYILIKHIQDKVIDNKTTLGNVLAGIKFTNWQIKEILGTDKELNAESQQFLLSKGVSYCNRNNIEVKPINVQTKGKLKESIKFVHKLRNFNQEERLLIFG